MPRSLLGLRPPAELASSPLPDRPLPDRNGQVPAAPGARQTARPDYAVVSSGWDSEDTENASKRSDLMTAMRAGIMLLLVMVGLGLLIGR